MPIYQFVHEDKFNYLVEARNFLTYFSFNREKLEFRNQDPGLILESSIGTRSHGIPQSLKKKKIGIWVRDLQKLDSFPTSFQNPKHFL